MFGTAFEEMFEDILGRTPLPFETQSYYQSPDRNQLELFCSWKDCTNPADFSDVTFKPRNQRFDFPIHGFYVKAEGRFCKQHCDEMREYVFEVSVWRPQKKT